MCSQFHWMPQRAKKTKQNSFQFSWSKCVECLRNKCQNWVKIIKFIWNLAPKINITFARVKCVKANMYHHSSEISLGIWIKHFLEHAVKSWFKNLKPNQTEWADKLKLAQPKRKYYLQNALHRILANVQANASFYLK